MQMFKLPNDALIYSKCILVSSFSSSPTGNRPHPSSPELFFKDGDSRLQYVMSSLDPRVHFALVCGAKVCYLYMCYLSWNENYHLRDFVYMCSCYYQVENVLSPPRMPLHSISFSIVNPWPKYPAQKLPDTLIPLLFMFCWSCSLPNTNSCH